VAGEGSAERQLRSPPVGRVKVKNKGGREQYAPHRRQRLEASQSNEQAQPAPPALPATAQEWARARRRAKASGENASRMLTTDICYANSLNELQELLEKRGSSMNIVTITAFLTKCVCVCVCCLGADLVWGRVRQL